MKLFLFDDKIMQNPEIARITSAAFASGFLSGYIYSIIGMFDLALLCAMGALLYNINDVILFIKKYKADNIDNSK